MNLRRALLLVTMSAALFASACSGAPAASPGPTLSSPPPSVGATPSPSPTSTTPAPPTVAPPTQVTSAAQAAALVFASDRRFTAMTALRSDFVGQASWYEAEETAEGFGVRVTIGSGDCMAGCIDRHTWTYAVGRDGTIELVADEGDPVEATPIDVGPNPAQVMITLDASPACPVQQLPPDPNCEPRPVVNGEVALHDPSGTEIGRGVTDAEGQVVFEVPGGAYYVEALPVEGPMQTPAAQAFSVPAGSDVGLLMSYDTGIR